MRLVIAEKPSAGKIFAAVLGAKTKNKGYLEGNGWLVSWCYGHLVGLADCGTYDPAYTKWRKEDLPIVPAPFRFTVKQDTNEQYERLCELMNRSDVEEIVNACDAGREGERIFRTVYDLCNCKKPVSRLWISSMEDNAVREGFNHLESGVGYENLYRAALCRAEADWLVGINATRFFTLLYRNKLNVGRVMSPTLALLVQREAEIAAFVPEPFYTVQIDCGFQAVTNRLTDRAMADSIASACHEAVVQSVERKEKTVNPPALYDLTTLQRDANRLIGFTAQQTLDTLQSLYEKKLCTYPRTDSRYLTDDMVSVIPEVLRAAEAISGYTFIGQTNGKAVCDSQKVSDHHALLPTEAAGRKNLDLLPGSEREILRMIAASVIRALAKPYRYEETTVTLVSAGAVFTAKGKTVLDRGWKQYGREPGEVDDVLPTLGTGQVLPVQWASVKEAKTTPPRRYTEDTLLAALENAGAKEMPDDAERKGLGTPATRASIIEKLIDAGFVERKKAQKVVALVPTDFGKNLIAILPEELKSPSLTAEWEHRLKEVERGERTAEDFIAGIVSMLTEMMENYQPVRGSEILFPSGKEPVGKCPRCGNDVTESQKGFFCENRGCRFVLWRDQNFFSSIGKAMERETAEALLKTGRVAQAGCVSRRTGRGFDCVVVMDDDGEKTRFELEFPKDREKE